MTAILRELSWKEDRDSKAKTEAFIEGLCYFLAIALHRGLGWPMVGLIENGTIWHVAVRSPEGVLWDGRGSVNEEEFGRPFGIRPPYDLRPVSEEDLRAVKPVGELFIGFALRIAQAAWPDLPWQTPTLRSRALAFAQDLEQLSRKHGLWIFGNCPASFPLIAEEGGGEMGYELVPTIDGLGYAINRVLGVSLIDNQSKRR